VRERDQVRQAAWLVTLTALAVVIFWVCYAARDALLVVYISVLLAIGCHPLVHAIEHQRTVPIGTPRLPRWLAILAVYLAIVGFLIVLGVLIVPPLVSQAADLWARLPDLLDRAQNFLLERGLLNHRITLEEAVQRAPGSPVGTVASAFTWTVRAAIGLVTVFILTFYLLVDSEALLEGFVRLFPIDSRARVSEVAGKISTKVSAWLSGQLILCGTIASSATLALYLLNVPYFYVLGLIGGIGEAIPVLGPVLSAIPAILAGLTVSPKTALFVAVFWIGQQQVENHLLVPKIMQRQVGVSPVIVIVALLVGASTLGIPGAALAVPTAAILQVVVRELLEERDRRAVGNGNGE
jgi:predicted PurR-regulated permease PerM